MGTPKNCFEPCIACAVHLTDPEGKELMQVRFSDHCNLLEAGNDSYALHALPFGNAGLPVQ